MLLAAPSIGAQSTLQNDPTAVRSTEIVGAIAARDIGDSRLTNHFYVFTGTPGDLLITVESGNLNGDVDVFSASGLRPLLKFTVYEGSGSATTKSIYLRKREDLILRIEARTPNDDEGTYRVRFGGSFEPISGGLDGGPVSTNETPSLDPTDTGGKASKKGRRVSSVGARIDEPAPAEVVAAPTPAPEAAEKPAASARRNPRNARVARPARGRVSPATAPPRPETAATETASEATSEPKEQPTTGEPASVAKSVPAPRSTPGRRRAGRRNTPTPPAEKAASPPLEESGPRLFIETSDGTMINRYMTSVRRVTVENGQVVVVGRDGKVERFLLANIVRMSVGP